MQPVANWRIKINWLLPELKKYFIFGYRNIRRDNLSLIKTTNMKLKLGVILGIITCTLLVAFTVVERQVKWGAIAEGEKGGQTLTLIGKTPGELYYLRKNSRVFKGNNYYIDIFSKDNLNRKKSTHLNFPDSIKKWNFGNFYVANDNVYMFMNNFDKKSKINSFYLYKIGMDGNFEQGILLEQFEEEKRRARSYSSVTVSADSSRLLVYSTDNNTEKERINFQMFKTNLVKEWEAELDMPYQDKDLTVSDIQVDNRGDVFMLIAVSTTDGSKKKKLLSRTLSLMQYSNKVGEFREYDLKLKNKLISEVSFALNKKGDLVASGFYSNKPGSSYAGVFYMLLDRESRDITSTVVQDFKPAFVAEFIGERKAEKGKELKNFYMRDLIVRDDGSAYMVSEFYQMVEVCRTDPKTGARTCTYHYYYNDLIVANFGNEGSVRWVKKIPKKQHTVNDGGYASGIYTQMVDNDLYLIYNTDAKNINPKKPGKVYTMSKYKKAFLVLHKVTESGDENIDVVIRNKDEKLVIAPRYIDALSAREVLLYDMDRNDYKLGALAL